MKVQKAVRSKPRNPLRASGRPFYIRKRALVLLVTLITIMAFQSTLSSPSVAPPALPVPTAFYPDYVSPYRMESHIVQPGDTLTKVLSRYDLPAECLFQWQETCSDLCRFNRLQPGEEFNFYTSEEDGQFVKFVYSTVDGGVYTFSRFDGEWECHGEVLEPVAVEEAVSGTISDNLYNSCLRAGLPPGLIMQMADMFAYDIDFNTDLRQGDTFAVHFQKKMLGENTVSGGSIIASEMVVGGARYTAFLYEFPDGYKDYFDENGRSLRKLFLKAPLSYSRISSTFTNARFHPILKITRPHHGIDYAAPQGTPVSALGDGIVTFIGKKGGYGKYIEITHCSTYKTTYGHLADFAKGLKKGSRVSQGDLIGYVGATGLATGPHLDFRFYMKGNPIDFLKTEFPNSRSIPGSLRADFNARKEAYLAELRKGTVARQNEDRDAKDKEES